MRTEKDVKMMNVLSVLFIALLLGTIAVAILSACGRIDEKTEIAAEQVETIKPQILSASTGEIQQGGYGYIVDTNTGVVYLRYNGTSQCAITVLLNKDGTPVTAEQLGIKY